MTLTTEFPHAFFHHELFINYDVEVVHIRLQQHPRLMVWAFVLLYYCLVPSQLNCVVSQSCSFSLFEDIQLLTLESKPCTLFVIQISIVRAAVGLDSMCAWNVDRDPDWIWMQLADSILPVIGWRWQLISTWGFIWYAVNQETNPRPG